VTAKTDHSAADFGKLQKSGFNRLFLKLLVTVSFHITKTVTNVKNYEASKFFL
jgi:hypothetical protein